MSTKSNAAEENNMKHLLWIHCNRCFEIYVRKRVLIYLLACQHLSCEKCLKPTGTADVNFHVCPICNKTVRVRQLGNVLPPHIKELFHPNPSMDTLPSMHILRFQQRHRTHFMEGMQRMVKDFEREKEKHAELRAEAKAKFETLEKLRYERKRLEQRVRKVIKRRQQIQEERRQMELAQSAAPHAAPHSGTTDESALLASENQHFQQRHRSSSAAMWPRTQHIAPRTLSPNSAGETFHNFAYRSNSFNL